MRRAAKVDTTQREIVRALERTGCLVLDLSRVGNGCPDLLVSRGKMLRLIECKAERGTLTDAQEEFLALGWPVSICWSADDALRVVGLLKENP